MGKIYMQLGSFRVQPCIRMQETKEISKRVIVRQWLMQSGYAF